MRFLHTSDWHLGKSDGETSLLEDQKFFIQEICRVITEQKVDAVLIAGDVFDRSLASAESLRLYNLATESIRLGCNVPVCIIAGNHDGAALLECNGPILSLSGLHLRGGLDADLAPVSIGDAEIFLLPWITEEKVKAVFPEEKENVTDLADAYAVVTGKMRELFTPDKRHILLAHAYAADAETSTSDRAAEIGFAAQIPVSVFDGFDYVALGHLHGPQKISGTVRYCGTPMPYSFGKEETQTKGVLIVDTETLEQTFVPIPVLHKRTTLKGTLEELLTLECDEATRQGFVRLEVTDSYVGLAALSDLKEKYAHILDVKDKTFEKTDSSIVLTLEDLERMEGDPMEVFRSFCREQTEDEAGEHFEELFAQAVNEVERTEENETN